VSEACANAEAGSKSTASRTRYFTGWRIKSVLLLQRATNREAGISDLAESEVTCAHTNWFDAACRGRKNIRSGSGMSRNCQIAIGKQDEAA
jgi:hypothetical protein